ncbi:MAG: aldehyde ferredoxin oxidoreductase family protein [Deltaproteobacteria bacterium]|nr:aldehyde ferredoxin oxidoreductase family protein [Deltaproteobacteria bacterium]
MTQEILGGYNGKVLRVNLSDFTTRTESIDAMFCRKYIGGAGFVSHFLLNELAAQTDALGEENKLVFAVGPLTGIALPGSGRHCIGAKSPLTGAIAKSEVGEFWGAELKMAGFDAVIIEGKSDKPVYLWIKDGEAEIRDGGHLWGQPTKETEEIIQKELNDDKIRTALIGPGGEKQVLYSCIMHGPKDAAGRGGLGAVMGSKKLKAVAVRGTARPKVVNPEGIKSLRQWLLDNMEKVSRFHEFGTGANTDFFEKEGNLPTRNFRDGAFPAASKISAQTIKETIRIGMEGCYACPVKCKKVVEIKEPYYVDPAYGGPEYETLGALGSNCGIDDLSAISRASALCNAYAIDTISTGGTIAFAMECFENGILTTQDTGGLELRFGNAEAMLKMVEMIGRREGIGDLLAEGTARAADKIGKGAERFSIQVKKLELPMHEPRLNKALALGFMVNPHGADHCCNMIDLGYRDSQDPSKVTVPEAEKFGLSSAPFEDIGPQKVALFRIVQLEKIVFDSLAICQFLPYSLEQLASATSAVTGWEITVAEQLQAAERTLTMYRLFNLRQGLSDKDDKLPSRFFTPTRYGALSETSLEPEKLEKAKHIYYELMGWDEKGVPRAEKLAELGIST